MFHIKDKGSFLCGKKINKHKPEMSISFLYAATNSNLVDCCPYCKVKIMNILGKMAKIRPESDDNTT